MGQQLWLNLFDKKNTSILKECDTGCVNILCICNTRAFMVYKLWLLSLCTKQILLRFKEQVVLSTEDNSVYLERI